jgi:hypothetical protein
MVPSVLEGEFEGGEKRLGLFVVFAVVVMLIFMPRRASILSYSISGKMICSLTPRL